MYVCICICIRICILGWQIFDQKRIFEVHDWFLSLGDVNYWFSNRCNLPSDRSSLGGETSKGRSANNGATPTRFYYLCTYLFQTNKENTKYIKKL